MKPMLAQLDSVLRGGPLHERAAKSAWMLVAAAVLCGFGYGATMGSIGFHSAERLLQVLYSATKVPLLLMVTFALCLPSFFVANTLLGLREDFPAAVRALLVTQCALTIVLLAMAPLTAFWYASDAGYDRAILFNAAMFAVASVTAQRVLRREYRPLIAANPRHRMMVRLWLLLYAFVGIQMGWVLRPFIGKPELPVRFFREEAWGNAYVEVMRILWRQVAG